MRHGYVLEVGMEYTDMDPREVEAHRDKMDAILAPLRRRLLDLGMSLNESLWEEEEEGGEEPGVNGVGAPGPLGGFQQIGKLDLNATAPRVDDLPEQTGVDDFGRKIVEEDPC